MKAAVICDAYRWFANMSLAVDVLAVAVSGGGGEEGSDGIVGGDTACCFPLSDAKVPVVSRMWVFVPWHPPASRQCRQHILRVHAG